MNFDNFNKSVDMDKYSKEIDAMRNNSGTQRKRDSKFQEIPDGQYACCLNKMGLKTSKSGKKSVSIWFKITDGKFKKSILFYNGYYESNFGRLRTAEFLNAVYAELDDDGETVDNTNNFYALLATATDADIEKALLDIHEANETLGYDIKYTTTDSGFKQFEVLDVFDEG